MSLQNLELPEFVIGELYKDLLVPFPPEKQPISNAAKPEPVASALPPATAKTASKPEPIAPNSTAPQPTNQPVTSQPASQPTNLPTNQPPFKHLGGNQKNITFIVHYPNDVFLPQPHLDWLGKLLEACQLNLGDIAILNIAKTPATIAHIKKELRSSTVILLGTEPLSIQLPINFPHFNLQSHDGMTFLCTPPVADLNQNTQEARLAKTKLWVSLQKLFKL